METRWMKKRIADLEQAVRDRDEQLEGAGRTIARLEAEHKEQRGLLIGLAVVPEVKNYLERTK